MSELVLHEWRYPRRTYRLLKPEPGTKTLRIQAEDHKGGSVTLRVVDSEMADQLMRLRGLLEEVRSEGELCDVDNLDGDPFIMAMSVDLAARIRQALRRGEES